MATGSFVACGAFKKPSFSQFTEKNSVFQMCPEVPLG